VGCVVISLILTAMLRRSAGLVFLVPHFCCVVFRLTVTALHAGFVAAVQRRDNSSFLKHLNESVGQLPMREAARYTKKNMKWTAREFDVSC
jgi:hypothetical protein